MRKRHPQDGNMLKRDLRDDRLAVFTHRDLADSEAADSARSVLLEGSWPEGKKCPAYCSLDDAIDVRFASIDQEATRLADELSQAGPRTRSGGCQTTPCNPAWLNALSLRYYLVKLLRVIVYFTQERPIVAGERVRVAASRGRDEDYVDCLEELCRRAGADCRVRWHDRPEAPAFPFPANPWWRRGIARLAGLLESRRPSTRPGPRVVLCGNPRLLDPVCQELLRCGASVWWLYDRFAFRSWFRWRGSGVGQLTCNSSLARENRLERVGQEALWFGGVDLSRPVGRWLAARLKRHGPRQTRLCDRIDSHFRQVRPHTLVVDEDATPTSRAAIAVARRHGATSWVLQHGAPLCRFGFAPLAADRLLAWGSASVQQLERWGVPAKSIEVAGSPQHGWAGADSPGSFPSRFTERAVKGSRRAGLRVLLVTTIPPRDERADAVALHLTRQTYRDMLKTALAVVSRIPEARLVWKPHPRAPDDPIAAEVLARFPALECRMVRRGDLATWLEETDCVLSCISSAGVDAALAGLPVIQLLPVGSGDILPHHAWGMFGTARTEAELTRLLDELLHTAAPLDLEGNSGKPFAAVGRAAARRACQCILEPRRRPVADRVLQKSP